MENFFKIGSIKGIQAIHADKLNVLLFLLNNINSMDDLNSPALRFHKLQGNMKNLFSITVQANWRLTFELNKETFDVYILNYQDYH